MAAMKDKDKDKLSVLRMVKGAIQLEEINKKKELDDNEVIAVISKQIKTFFRKALSLMSAKIYCRLATNSLLSYGNPMRKSEFYLY